MSVIHRALDRSAKPEKATAGEYNPLQRSRRPSSKHWWAIAGAALLASAAVLILPRVEFRSEPASPAVADAQLTGKASLPPKAEQTEPSLNTIDRVTETPFEATQVVSSSSIPDSPATPVNAIESIEKLAESNDTLSDSNEKNTVSIVDNNKAQSSSADAKASVSSSVSASQDTANPIATVESLPESEPQPTPLSTASTPPEPQTTIVSTVQEPAPNKTGALAIAADNPSEVEAQSQPSPAQVAVTPASTVATAVPRHVQSRQAVQLAISRQNIDQAQALLASWIEREPTLEEPRLWLAKINLNNGRQRDAEALLIGLRSPEALGLRGLILEQTERFADAARVFESLTREDSGNPQWWLHWAINMENSGRIEEAQLLYQTYLQQFSSHNARLTAFASERYRALARL